MTTSIQRFLSLSVVACMCALGALGGTGCSAGADDPDSDELVGAPEEDTGEHVDAVSGSIKVGTKLVATANVNLRTGPSTSKSILHVVPNGATVTVVEAAPKSGFYKVKHSGTVGWSYGVYYKLAGGGTSSAARDAAIGRAKSGKGFSYWWGHGRFLADGPTSSTKGSCSGSCPSCSHKGSYGGDCSGYAAKVWKVPASNAPLSDDWHPFSTFDFDKSNSLWSSVSRSNMKKADAMVYNSNGAGHIFIYAHGDGWGSMYAYECKGCSYGCVAGYRTASSAYHGIRRAGW